MPKNKTASTYQFVGTKNVYGTIVKEILEGNAWGEYDTIPPQLLEIINRRIFTAYDSTSDEGREAIDNFMDELCNETFKSLRDKAL